MLDRQQTGIVFNVQKFSVHDGEGIRTLVFLKGCPLHCPWCSNPESQRREPERAYNPTRCLTAAVCGRCAKACPTGAVSIVGGLVCFDRSKCTGCNACVRACPSGAQTVYGETQSVDQILSRVEEDGVFYTRSGGGLTLSGGEALAQPDFALALLREAKKRHIHTTIETCGHYPTDVLDQACRVLDALIFDIKCLDSARHKKATGVGSELILKNIGHVFEHFPELPVLIRTPVIPGFNDTEEDILGGAGQAFDGGWNKVKLYFMLGLPGETYDDIEGIAILSDKIAREYYTIPKDERNGKVSIVTSTSIFVPKPFTPFQWSPMNTKEQAKDKRNFLLGKVREQLNQKSIKYNCHDADVSELEGVFARGDRRLNKVILEAYQSGCFYDAWSEYFKYENWLKAFEDNGLDRPEDELFPWDFIDIGVTKKFMRREYENSLKAQVTPNCRVKCAGCGAMKFKCGVCVENLTGSDAERNG